MRAEHDAMMVVRAELCERLETLQRLSRRQSARDITESVAGIKRLAAAYGLTPVVRLSDAIERALKEQDRPCPPALYLDRLYDAIGCERLDEQASEAILASVSMRLGH
jgi:hypothetical protein